MDEQFVEMMRSEKIADQCIIDALDKKVYDMRNLIEVGISLSSNLDFQALVDSILYSCIGQLFIEKIAILLQEGLDTTQFTVNSSKGYTREPQGISLGRGSTLVCFLEDNPVPHDYQSLLEYPELLRDLQHISILEPEMIIPMKSKNLINGILVLGSKIQKEHFSSDEREFLRGLARFSSTAVENSRLYQMATMDRMTRLFIHHYFQEKLLEAFTGSERTKAPLSIFISDIDHFKVFNDTYGHQQGDAVLKEVARILRDTLRKPDLPARYGGEEFAAILPDTDIENAVRIASRYRRTIEEAAFDGQENPLHVTISIGVAQFDPLRDRSTADLISRADRALYRAKHSGRNKVAAFK